MMNYRLIGQLSMTHAIGDINQGLIPVLLPFLIAQHHFSYAAAAGIVLAVNISSSIIQPLFGYTADRFSIPLLIPVGLVLAGMGVAGMGILPSYSLLILAAVISGIGIAAYHPEGARLVHLTGGQHQATAMSMFHVGGMFGFAVGPLLGTFILARWGLGATPLFLVPVSVMALVMAVRLPRFSGYAKTSRGHRAGPPADIGADAWFPFSRLTVVVFGRSVLFYALITFIPLYWIDIFQRSKAAAGLALSLMAAAGVIGTLAGGWLADRVGQRPVMLAGYACLIPLLPAFLWVDSAVAAILLLMLIGMMLAVPAGPAIVIGQRYLPNHIGLSSGVTLGLAVAFGGMAVPFLGSLADHHGIRSALTAVAFLPVLNTVMTLTLPDAAAPSSEK